MLKCYELQGFINRDSLPLRFRGLSRTKFFACDFPKISVIVIANKELAPFLN